MERPHIVLLGGALRPNSSTERLLRLAGRKAEAAGASVTLFCGSDIDFPAYAPERVQPVTAASKMIAALMSADGIIVGSPGYHGSISGLVKNALDYVEQLRDDARPYFDGRPVGCIVTAAGWQGAVSTLSTLRDIVHALRGWPTPLGVTVNTASPLDGDPCNSLEVHRQMDILVDQVLGFRAVGRDAAAQQMRGRNEQFAAGTQVL
jgi:FMN reductase